MSGSGKRGFVLYFDAYPNVADLPADQRGELFSALYELAMDAAEGGGDMAATLARRPAMGLEARMAFHFMGGAVLRDTEKWQEKHRRYREAALRRRQEAGGDAWAYVGTAKSPPDGRL